MSPLSIGTVEELEDILSEPPHAVVDALRRLQGDLVILGVAGKMGPTLARMAKRASVLAGVKRRVIGVSRFSSTSESSKLEQRGIETIRCDLLDETAVQRLPEAPNIIFMAGMKFGSTGQESLTWAMNTHLPAIVCKKFSRSRIVAFSTGNVYGLVPVGVQASACEKDMSQGAESEHDKLKLELPQQAGSVETDSPNPLGEYAMSCLGRERMFEHFSHALHIPMALVRLNYACELRYGVLVDLAQKIFSGTAIDLSMGWLNTIWQADANAMALRCFDHVSTPPFVINVTGPELLGVRDVCQRLARRMGKEVCFKGEAAQTALLNNAQRAFELFGKPRVGAEQICDWVADWVSRGGETINKPTHFESRDGKF